VLLIGALIIVPTAITLFHSTSNWNPGYNSPFVGLANYRELASSPAFHEVLKNEAIFLLGLPLWTILPLVMTLTLYERVPLAGLFRTLLFIPSVLSPAIIGILFTAVLAPDGLVNAFLRRVGLDGLARAWLINSSLVKPVLILVLTWASLGIGVIIFSASLSSIPTDLFEAARIDGARWRDEFRYIMLPVLRPTIEFWVLYQALGVFVNIFPWIYVLTGGGPGYASTTVDYDIYETSFTRGYFGVAAAEAVYLLAIVVILVGSGVVLRRRARRER
jgi:ABC-type sugar transport system permease subunit